MGFCGQASLGKAGLLRFAHHRAFRAHECQWPSTQPPLEFQSWVPHQRLPRGRAGMWPGWQALENWVVPGAARGENSGSVLTFLQPGSPFFQRHVVRNCFVFSQFSFAPGPSSLSSFSLVQQMSCVNQTQAFYFLDTYSGPPVSWVLTVSPAWYFIAFSPQNSPQLDVTPFYRGGTEVLEREGLS